MSKELVRAAFQKGKEFERRFPYLAISSYSDQIADEFYTKWLRDETIKLQELEEENYEVLSAL